MILAYLKYESEIAGCYSQFLKKVSIEIVEVSLINGVRVSSGGTAERSLCIEIESITEECDR